MPTETVPITEIAAGVTSALVGAWDEIRTRHPDVAEAVVTMATGGRESAVELAHFEPRRWRLREGGKAHHEVFVTAESLADGAEKVLGYLMHEAVHAACETRGVKDCSASQYHNKKFRDVAAELGLDQRATVTPYWKKKYGFAGTELSEKAKVAYADQITVLDKAIWATRVPTHFAIRTRGGGGAATTTTTEDHQAEDHDDETLAAPEKEDRNYARATCACTPPTVIRVSPRTLDRKTIMCASCTTLFTRDDSV